MTMNLYLHFALALLLMISSMEHCAMSDPTPSKPPERQSYALLLALAAVLTAGATFLKEIVALVRTIAGI